MAMLGMHMLHMPCAGAANAAGASECARLDALYAHHGRSGATVTLTADADTLDPAAFPERRIAVWGDSLTSARDFLDAALEVQGIPKDAVQPSFVQAGVGVAGLRLPVKAACASAGWRLAYAHKEKTGRTGFSQGFLSMSSDNPGATLTLDWRAPTASARVKELSLLYEKPRPDSSLMLGVAVDGGEEEFISLSRSAGSLLRIRPATPMSSVRIRLVSGKITMHGLLPRYQDGAAAIVDTFSVPGGLLRSWSNADARLMSAAALPDYSLVLVQYGTNEGAGPSFSRDGYFGYLRANLARMRQFHPRARCILIGPPDRGVVGAAGTPRALRYAAVHAQIAAAQRQVGQEFRCEFWDWQAAMGGPGSAARWARMAPPHMQQDLTHLTAKGYHISGRLFAQAMLLNKN